MNTRIALFLVVFSPFFQLYAQNETEPNNSFATANTIISGNTMTGNLLQTGGDTYDFFEGTLTPFGVLRVIITGTNQVSVANSVSMVGFFADQAQFSGFNTIFLPAGTGSTVTDTFYFECIAPGIVYFRMEANSYLNYELRFDVLGDLDFTEQEPNNTFLQANFLQEGDTAKGYISYGNGSGTYDGFDYYKATLNDYGTVEIYFEGININSSTVIPDFVTYYSDQGQASGFNYLTVPAYSTVADTFRYPCLSPGDYYFRVESNSCLKYRLSFRVIHTIQSNETEPNNSFANASLLMPGDTARGHITHSNGFGTNDQYDFWVIPVPVASQIKFHVSATETAYSGSSAIGFITFSKNQGQMAYKYINTNNLNTFLDSVIVDCYNQDTLYIRVEASGCHTYSIIPEVINRKPIAQFAYDRLGNNIGFRPMLDNITSMSWNFDDGTTSTSQFPLHNYPFGNWTPQLIAINSACNYSDTASTYFEISGVEYYTPHRSGQGGDISLRVFGGSLTSQTQVKLIQGSTILTPVESYANLESNVFNAIFDLHLADSGYYDLEIIIPGQTPVLYQNGFYVEGIRYPETYAEIIGPNRFLVGRDAPFRIVVGNKGNVNANGVVVGFAWPASVEVNLLHQRIRQPETGNMVVSENDTTYSLPYSETAFTYDSLNTVIQIDTLNGQPFSGFMRMIVIPHIPPGATYELPFTAKANSQGSTRFFVYTHRPNLFGSPTTPNWLDMIEGTAYEAIDYVDLAADGTKNVPLIVAAKTLKVGQKHIALAGKAAGARFWAWWDGYEVADETY
ncbi:MAG: hypothetical protein KDD63_14520, partial [Bacteroidetes bacterium]|nr:hypothetical protein [Bacteroidota bacterium]